MNQQDNETHENEITSEVALRAVWHGIGDGIQNAVSERRETASKLTEPGDQRHIPHPIDDLAAGVSSVWQAVTTPADMNIRHSAHPVDAVTNTHGALVSASADLFAEKGVEQGIRQLTALATVAAIDNADPFKKFQLLDNVADVANIAESVAKGDKAVEVLQTWAKITPIPIDWNTYEHLLGYGSQPPKLKPLRDFSDLMDYEKPRPYGFTSRIVYSPQNNHKLVINLYHHSASDIYPGKDETFMRFLVRAEGNRELYGTGPEMFHSALRRLDRECVRVDYIVGHWDGSGNYTTNYDVFADALKHGASVKEAVRSTPIGYWLTNEGYTEVGGYSLDRLTSRTSLPEVLNPEFRRPAFSQDAAFNTYGNNWANSQGSSHVDPVPRHEVQSGKLQVSALSTFEQELKQLPSAQQDAVMRRILDNWDRQLAKPGFDIDPDLEFK